MSSNNRSVEFENEASKNQHLSASQMNTPAVSTSDSSTLSLADENCASRGLDTSDMSVLSKSLVDTLRELNQMNTRLLEMKSRLKEMRVTAAEELLELSLLHRPRQREVLAEVQTETSSSATVFAQHSSKISEQIQSLRTKGEDQLSSLKRKKEEYVQLVSSLECPAEEGQTYRVITGEDKNRQLECETVKDDSASIRHLIVNVSANTKSGVNSAIADSISNSVGDSNIDAMHANVSDDVLKISEKMQTQGKNSENCQSTEIVVGELTDGLTLYNTGSQAVSHELDAPQVLHNENPNDNMPVRSDAGELSTEITQEAFCRTNVEEMPNCSTQVLTVNVPASATEAPIVSHKTRCETSSQPLESDNTLRLSDAVECPILSADLTTTTSANLVSAVENDICLPRAESTASCTIQDFAQITSHEELGCRFDSDQELLLNERRLAKDLISSTASDVMQSDDEQPLNFPVGNCNPVVDSSTFEINVNDTAQRIALASENNITDSSPKEKIVETTEAANATFANDIALDSSFPTKDNTEPLAGTNPEFDHVAEDCRMDVTDDCNMDVTLCVESTRIFPPVTSPLELNDSDREVNGSEQVDREGATESETNFSEHFALTSAVQSHGIEPQERSLTFPQCAPEGQAESTQAMEFDN